MDINPIIARDNDAFRRSIVMMKAPPGTPLGKAVMTQGVAAQPPDFLLELTRSVATFDAFTEDSDPYGQHEMGVIEIAGETVWFKIDLYDTNYEYGAEDPTNSEQTRRVLTMLFPSEY